MKVLFIGGSGNISSSCVRLACERGHAVSVLNRGNRPLGLPGVRELKADCSDPESMRRAIGNESFDVVANFIAFTPADIDRDFSVFKGRVGQYYFVSSASVYQKPLAYPFINESCPLANPYWQYSRDKIASEERCNALYREHGFPIVIVRPALTYATVIPVALGSWNDFTIIDRIRRGQPVIIHGDGTSLWTVTHADDFALGFVGLFGCQQALGHAFHITSDEVLTWNQIYEAVADAAGAPLKAVHIPSDFIGRFEPFHIGNLLGDKAQSKIFDNSKIKAFVPGFRAGIRFRDGIARTVRWFEEDKARCVVHQWSNDFLDRVIAAYSRALDAAPKA